MTTSNFVTTFFNSLAESLRELFRQLLRPEEENAQYQVKLDELAKRIRESNIQNFGDLQRFDEKAAADLINLARQVEGLKLHGRNFGFFGITSSGKSTIINKLIGTDVAEVGAGETTAKIEAYEGIGYTLYDIPGRNDELSYFSMEYISFWKGLTGRFVVITATVKEMTNIFNLLDAIDLPYDIVVNKLDHVDVEDREKFKEKIRNEVEQLGLKGCKRIWFLSAKNSKQFPDWLDMVNYLTQ